MSGLKIGDIDIGDQVLQNEYDIRFLYRVIDKLLEKNKGKMSPLTSEELSQLRRAALEDVKKKYPNSGIDLK